MLKRSILLCCPLFFLFIFCVNGQVANTNISNGFIFDGEPYLAVNPVNHQNIVIAWMSYTYQNAHITIKTKTSFDGGNTWGNQISHPHFSPNYGSADVSMAFDKTGNLFMSYIDYRQNPDSGGIYMFKSIDGGVSWNFLSQAWDISEDTAKEPIDRPWMVVDNSGTTNDGTVYLTTKPAPWIPAPNRPYLKVSSDQGASWGAYRYVDTTGHLVGNNIQAPMGALTTTTDGALCIVYPSYMTSQSIYPKYYLAKSYNQGASFQYYDVLVNPTPVNNSNYKLGYHLAANPVNANQLAFAFVDARDGDPDVFVTTTNNGGQGWTSPVRVNDDSIGNGKAQDLVWANYGDDGILAVTWRDRRNGSGTGFQQPTDVYGAVSADNGQSFSSNIRLSSTTAPFDTVLYSNGNDFMCNYLYQDTLYATWGDTRTGKMNIFFAKTSISTLLSISPSGSVEKQAFRIYPNPVKEKLIIHCARNYQGNVKGQIYDMRGRLISNNIVINGQKGSRTEVTLKSFISGSYILHILDKDDNMIYSHAFQVVK